MESIRFIIRTASRRLGLTALLERAHLIAIVVATICLLTVVLGKAFPVIRDSVNWSWLAPGAAALTALAACIWWSQRRPGPLHVAIVVDDRLELREKLSTAMLCRGREDSFAQAAVDDAINVANDPRTRERVNRLFPIAAPRNWWVSPTVVAVTLLAGWLVPSGHLFAREEPKQSRDDQRQVQEIAAEVQQQIEDVAQTLGKDPKELKDLLGEAEAKPASETPSPDEAKKDAFQKYEKMQELLREVAQSDKAMALDAMSSKLNQLKTTDSGPTSELSKSLAKGDFKAAKEALEKLDQQLKDPKLTPEQREKLAQQLADLAEQLNKLAQQNQALADALKQAGVDPSLSNNPEALQKALENAANLTDEQKKQLANMARAMAQANSNCKSMGGALSAAASQMAGNGPMGEGNLGEMSGQLSEMEMLSGEMASLNAKCEGLGAACQKMGAGLGACQGQGISQSAAMQQWMMQNMLANGRGPGMGQRGQGAGGIANKTPIQLNANQDKAKIKSQEGPIIGTRFIEGSQLIRGESQRTFAQIVESAGSRAMEEIDDSLIPPQYKEAVQHFFGELKQKAAEPAAQPATPAAEPAKP